MIVGRHGSMLGRHRAALEEQAIGMSDYLELTEADDGKRFRIRVLNTGEERIARFHHLTLAGREVRFPCFADPDQPEDYLRWVHDGNARAVSEVRQGEGSAPTARGPDA